MIGDNRIAFFLEFKASGLKLVRKAVLFLLLQQDDILLHSAIQDGILDIHVLIYIAITDCIIPHTA